MEFKSTHKGRFHVNVHATRQFKTNHLTIKLVLPLTRESVTSTALLPYLWMEGTATHPTAESLQRYTDELYGASLRTGVAKRGDKHVVEGYIGVADETGLDQSATGLWEQAVELLFEVVSTPNTENHAFPSKHLAREITLHRHRIDSIFDDKIAFAADRCLTEATKGHAAGLPRLGYASDLTDITVASMFDTHQQVLAKAEVFVYAVGNFTQPLETVNALMERVLKTFGADSHETAARTVPLSYRNESDPSVVIEEQRVTQGKLDLVYRTGLSAADELYPAMIVMNGIFGASGFPNSKLFQNVRERASLAYYCSSRFDSLTGMLLVQTGIEVRNYEKALGIIKDQVEALQNGEISDDEMAFTKLSLRNQYTQLSDFPISVADLYFNMTLAGTSRTIDALLSSVESVTKADVQRVANKLQLDTIYLLKDKEVSADA